MISRSAIFLIAGLGCAHSLLADAGFDVPLHYQKIEVRVPMRDGTRLFTSIYSPKDKSVKYPLLLTRTPYSVGPYGADAYPTHLGPADNFAQDGFIFVYQDVRGRYESEGQWAEMRPEGVAPGAVDESTDTYDTIEWLIANVPNNNGKVGLIGTSYPGFYTDAGLIHAHPALAAASPQAPVSDLYMGDDAFHNGAFFLLANFGFYTFFNKQNNPEPPHKEEPFDYGTADGYRFFMKMGSIADSNEKYFRFRNPYWTAILQHPNYDDFWKSRDILPHLQAVKPAVLVVGGWFDAEDLSGTLKTFRAIESQSPETELHLVMGPWVHGNWGAGTGERLGPITFGGDNSKFFHDNIELPFFKRYLKGEAEGSLPKAYVFETGKNLWLKEKQWPPANTAPQRFYLRAEERLSETPPDKETGFDRYVSDPANPVPFFDRPTVTMEPTYMNADQRFVQARPDVLSYRSDPLREDLTIAGPISPTLYVSTSGSDSDFVVKLIDVYPDKEAGALAGYEQLVRGEPFRGKFRNSFESPQPFEPGKVEQIRFTMPDVFHCFQKGHRIMVQVQSSWFPLIDRNPQTFTDIPTAKQADFIEATERVYHSKTDASFIELNVVR